MKSFTLVEILVAVVIFGLVIAGLIMILNSGFLAYNTDSCLLGLQQNARVAMDRMVRELREGLPGTIINGGNQITFNTPNENGIRYYYDAINNRIMREYPAGTNTILANNITNLNFPPLIGSLLEIQITAVNPQRPNINFFLRERVRFRN